MNIKSLMLGSAVAMAGVSGAQAADAIFIPEPEPMEYVRVCDVYGAGFFYIPGTETCLRINGYVRMQVGGTDRRLQVPANFPLVGAPAWTVGGHNVVISSSAPTASALVGYPAGTTIADVSVVLPAGTFGAAQTGALFATETRRDRQFQVISRVAVNFDARSETEFGLLRGWVNLETGSAAVTNRDLNVVGNNDIDMSVNRAIIQLGGVFMGYTDSLFSSSSTMLGSSVGNYGGHNPIDTLPYAYHQRQMIGFQYSAPNGFYAAVAVENDPATPFTSQNFVPDVAGKLAFAQSWGGVYGQAVYDESARGWAGRLGAEFNVPGLANASLRAWMYYYSKAGVSHQVSTQPAQWNFAVSGSVPVAETLSVNAGFAYANRLNIASAFFLPGSHAWSIQGGAVWTPVRDFAVSADVIHTRTDFGSSAGAFSGVRQQSTTAAVRFQRNF